MKSLVKKQSLHGWRINTPGRSKTSLFKKQFAGQAIHEIGREMVFSSLTTRRPSIN